MDDRHNPTAGRQAGGDPAWRSGDRASLYAARLASPEVARAREVRWRAERYASRGIVPFGRQRARRARRQRRALVASVAALSALVGGGSAALAGQAVYQIKAGDTLSEIAETYGSTVEALATINALDDPDLIITGESLVIPLEGASAEVVHVVEWGDTLSELAEAYGSTVEDIAARNGLSNPDLIIVGDELTVPIAVDATPDPVDMSDDVDGEHGSVNGDDDTVETPDAEPAPSPVEIEIAALHLVTEGETLESIASLYGISVDALLAANGQATNGVAPGMILAIPEGATAGVQLVGVPDVDAETPEMADAAALAAATGYWGGEIPMDETRAAIAASGDAFTALAGLLERYGYHAGVFDSGSGAPTLTAQIDAGFPVIVWIADDAGQRAVVVQGYDDDGVLLFDALGGSLEWLAWETFGMQWDAGGGMAIAVAPL